MELSDNKALFFLTTFANSTFAVKGFFVISGFLVTKSYINTPSLKNYFIKRAKRILPAYIFVILLTTIILSLISTTPSFFEYFLNTATIKYFFWNVLFLNFLSPCLPGVFENNSICAVNGALWTLKIEEGFYVFLPILFYIINRFKKPTLILFVFYLLSLIYWYVLQYNLNMPMLAKQLPGYLSYFVVGIFLFLNFENLIKHKVKVVSISLVLLLISTITNFNIYVLLPAVYGILIICAAFSFPFLNHFGKYGDFTYGLYIYHFPIIQIFRHYNLFEKMNPILVCFSILIITLIFAIFSWFVIEKRFLDRYKINKN